MPNFAGGLTTSTLCVWELESPYLGTLCTSFDTENLSILCTLIIYLFSVKCLMLTRSNTVSNMLNQYCSHWITHTKECLGQQENLVQNIC